MKKILSLFLLLSMFSLFAFIGCEEKRQVTPVEVGKINNPAPTLVQEKEIKPDKTYFNKRFKFEVKYPSVWSLIEEEDNPSFPDQGVYIFIGDSKVSSIDSNNINKIDHIRIFGQVSSIAIPEAGMTIGEFVTNDGIKAVTYFGKADGMLNTYYVLEETDGMFGYGARVCVSESTNDKYKEVIAEILKSIKIIQN